MTEKQEAMERQNESPDESLDNLAKADKLLDTFEMLPEKGGRLPMALDPQWKKWGDANRITREGLEAELQRQEDGLLDGKKWNFPLAAHLSTLTLMRDNFHMRMGKQIDETTQESLMKELDLKKAYWEFDEAMVYDHLLTIKNYREFAKNLPPDAAKLRNKQVEARLAASVDILEKLTTDVSSLVRIWHLRLRTAKNANDAEAKRELQEEMEQFLQRHNQEEVSIKGREQKVTITANLSDNDIVDLVDHYMTLLRGLCGEDMEYGIDVTLTRTKLEAMFRAIGKDLGIPVLDGKYRSRLPHAAYGTLSMKVMNQATAEALPKGNTPATQEECDRAFAAMDTLDADLHQRAVRVASFHADTTALIFLLGQLGPNLKGEQKVDLQKIVADFHQKHRLPPEALMALTLRQPEVNIKAIREYLKLTNAALNGKLKEAEDLQDYVEHLKKKTWMGQWKEGEWSVYAIGTKVAWWLPDFVGLGSLKGEDAERVQRAQALHERAQKLTGSVEEVRMRLEKNRKETTELSKKIENVLRFMEEKLPEKGGTIGDRGQLDQAAATELFFCLQDIAKFASTSNEDATTLLRYNALQSNAHLERYNASWLSLLAGAGLTDYLTGANATKGFMNYIGSKKWKALGYITKPIGYLAHEVNPTTWAVRGVRRWRTGNWLRRGGTAAALLLASYEASNVYASNEQRVEQEDSLRSLSANLRELLPKEKFTYDEQKDEYTHTETGTKISVKNIDALAREFLGADYARMGMNITGVLSALAMLVPPAALAGMAVFSLIPVASEILHSTETKQWNTLLNALPYQLLPFLPLETVRGKSSNNFAVWKRVYAEQARAVESTIRLRGARVSGGGGQEVLIDSLGRAKNAALYMYACQELLPHVPAMTDAQGKTIQPLDIIWKNMSKISGNMQSELPGFLNGKLEEIEAITPEQFQQALHKAAMQFLREHLVEQYENEALRGERHERAHEQFLEDLGSQLSVSGAPRISLAYDGGEKIQAAMKKDKDVQAGLYVLAGYSSADTPNRPATTTGIMEAVNVMDVDTEVIPLLQFVGKLPAKDQRNLVAGLQAVPRIEQRLHILRSFVGRTDEGEEVLWTHKKFLQASQKAVQAGLLSPEEFARTQLRKDVIGSQAPGVWQYSVGEYVDSWRAAEGREINAEKGIVQRHPIPFQKEEQYGKPELPYSDLDAIGTLTLEQWVQNYNKKALPAEQVRLQSVATKISNGRRIVANNGRAATPALMLEGAGRTVYFRCEGGHWYWASQGSPAWLPIDAGRYSDAVLKKEPIFAAFNAAADYMREEMRGQKVPPSAHVDQVWKKAYEKLGKLTQYNPQEVEILPGVTGVQLTDGKGTTVRFYSLGGRLRWDQPPRFIRPQSVDSGRYDFEGMTEFHTAMNALAGEFTKAENMQ